MARVAGIYNDAYSAAQGENGLVILEGTRVSNNLAEGNGGGICNHGKLVTDAGVQIDYNRSALAGGGIYNDSSADSWVSGTITENNAWTWGGGIYNDGKASLTISEVRITRNLAEQKGGGIDQAGTLLANGLVVIDINESGKDEKISDNLYLRSGKTLRVLQELRENSLIGVFTEKLPTANARIALLDGSGASADAGLFVSDRTNCRVIADGQGAPLLGLLVTVHFTVNDAEGKGEMEAQGVIAGDSYDFFCLFEPKNARTYFAGWQNGSKFYPREQAIQVNGETTLLAVWADGCELGFFDRENPSAHYSRYFPVEDPQNWPMMLCALPTQEEAGFTAPAGTVLYGWETKEKTKFYYPGQRVQAKTTVRFYAVWKAAHAVTLTYAGESRTVYVADGDPLPGFEDVGFTLPEGQEFAGWLVNQEPVGEDYTVVSDLNDVTPGFGASTHVHEDGERYVRWYSSNRMPETAGNYCLMRDVLLGQAWEVPEGETRLCLNGHSLRQLNEGERVVHIGARGTLILDDCKGGGKVCGGSLRGYDSCGGGLYLEEGAGFVMNGGSLTENTADQGGAVFLEEGASFVMNGGEITLNNDYFFESTGAVVYLEESYEEDVTTFVMNGGSITENFFSFYGGGVYVGYNASFTMTDGEISGNDGEGSTASMGGGVYVGMSGHFTMEGGKICGNTAGSGGGIYVDELAEFKMLGGSVTKNEADNQGGGIFVDEGADFKLEGAVRIRENYLSPNYGWEENNIYLSDRFGITRINITDVLLCDEKDIGLSVSAEAVTKEPYIVTDGLRGNAELTQFVSDAPEYIMMEDINISGEIAIGDPITLKFESGSETAEGVMKDVDWMKNLAYELPACAYSNPPLAFAGWEYEYTVVEEGKEPRKETAIRKTSQMISPSEYTVFKAHWVEAWKELQKTIDAAADGAVIALEYDCGSLAEDGPLVIPQGRTITLDLNGFSLDRRLESPADDGCAIINNGTLTVTDGSKKKTGRITGAKNTGNGGAILNRGTLTIDGGTITGNTADQGGGIFNESGSLNVSGGEISGNSAGKNGGGIYSSGELTLKGGSVTGNTCGGNGAGLYVEGDAGTFRMSGTPRIQENEKTGHIANNLYLGTGSLAAFRQDSPLSPDAAIGVSLSDRRVFSDGFSKSGGSLSSFLSDDPEYKVVSGTGGELKLVGKVKITTKTADGNGELSVEPASAFEGEKVTLTVTPEVKYRVKSFAFYAPQRVDIPVENNIFTVPEGNADINIVAEFEMVPEDELEVELSGHSISLDGDIAINYYLKVPSAYFAWEGAKMRFTVPEASEGYRSQEILLKDVQPVTVNGESICVFKCRVPAKKMGEDITGKIVCGTLESDTITYTVRRYADELLTNADDEHPEFKKAAPLVRAMLDYGRHAENYFDDSAEVLESLDTEIPEFGYTIELPEYAELAGATLSLKSETTLSLFFTSSEELQFTSDWPEMETERVTKDYVVRFRNIPVAELDREITLTVNNEGTISYSPLTYCYLGTKSDSVSLKLKNTVKALYLYWQEAKAYFPKQ